MVKDDTVVTRILNLPFEAENVYFNGQIGIQSDVDWRQRLDWILYIILNVVMIDC